LFNRVLPCFQQKAVERAIAITVMADDLPGRVDAEGGSVGSAGGIDCAEMAMAQQIAMRPAIVI